MKSSLSIVRVRELCLLFDKFMSSGTTEFTANSVIDNVFRDCKYSARYLYKNVVTPNTHVVTVVYTII